jgi:hypothetical protein
MFFKIYLNIKLIIIQMNLIYIYFFSLIKSQFFKTNNISFLHNINNNWIDFGKFAAINLGVTKPGYEPGNVILRREDYLRRFKRAEVLGVNVIRVYALLHPEFYDTLLEWNENNNHKIYVLHGTAIPEYEMEGLEPETKECVFKDINNVCIQGADVYDPNSNINKKMKNFIERTVKGVYGQGEVVYQDRNQVKGFYKSNIVKYLLGWIISGEIPPSCIFQTNIQKNHIYQTNEEYNIGDITNSKNIFVYAKDNSTPFEFWIAKMLDYTAQQINKYGFTTPISHTNWVTTDGIKNYVEPRYDDIYTSSIEDWQEIDFKHIEYRNWDGFYNQHIYPYYPEFISEKNSNDDDQIISYINKLEKHYNDLPFILSEIGISTSLGVASYDTNYGRHHGSVEEKEQGKLMKDLMLKIMDKTSTYGIIVFQLHDEWFKKSWNTRIYERNERQTWLNVFSAEQGFGIFSTRPDESKLKYNTIEKDSIIKSLSVSHDSAYIHIKVKKSEILDTGTLLIGFDAFKNIGTYETKNYPRKFFRNQIESFISIDIEKNTVNFKQLQSTIPFVRHYGEWLTLNEIDDYKLDLCDNLCRPIIDIERDDLTFNKDCYKICFNKENKGNGDSIFDLEPNVGKFIDWKLLVKTPGFIYPGRNETNYQDNKYQYNNYSIHDPVCYDINDGHIHPCDPNNSYLKYSKNVRQLDINNLTYLLQNENNTEHRIVYRPHLSWIFNPSEKNDTFSYKDNEYTIKIPWAIFGYIIPGYHKQYRIPVNTGKDYIIPNYNLYESVKMGINIETSVLIGGTNIPNSEIYTNYQWDKWEIPNHWCIKAKKGFRDFRSAFHIINNYKDNDITDEEIESLSECYFYDNSKNIGFIIHKYLVIFSFVFLFIMYFLGAFKDIIKKHLLYCYSFQNDKNISTHLTNITKIFNFVFFIALCIITYLDWNITEIELDRIYIIYLLLLTWDSFVVFFGMLIIKWDIYEEKEIPEYNHEDHAFIVSCHNSSDVIENTLLSLLTKCEPHTIYVSDNGSTLQEQNLTKLICDKVTKEYYNKNNLKFDNNKIINYGHFKIGNKTMSQFASVSNLPNNIKYVTCIDDDTRLHKTWNIDKVINYFQDERVVVLAYPLTTDNPKYIVEFFQKIEYIVAGFTKLWQGKIWSTIFNSGAFGTYRKEILLEAFQYHNTDFHGDDLQICLIIHQLKGKKYITQKDKIHDKNYRVITARDMIVSTIVPKCFLHLRSISPTLFKSECSCNNPDLFKQRSKGWFVSKHRFIPKYLKLIFNCKGFPGIWVRFIALYDLIFILNEYLLVFYLFFIFKYFGWWMIEAFLIGIAFNTLSILIFNIFVLKRNKLYIPIEVISTQPLIYKIFMISIYRYCGLLYNLFYYLPTHRSGKIIKERLKDNKFIELVNNMYKSKDQENIEIVIL